MQAVALPWADWRSVIALLLASEVPYKRQHANVIEEQLERHGSGETTVRLSLIYDEFLGSYT